MACTCSPDVEILVARRLVDSREVPGELIQEKFFLCLGCGSTETPSANRVPLGVLRERFEDAKLYVQNSDIRNNCLMIDGRLHAFGE